MYLFLSSPHNKNTYDIFLLYRACQFKQATDELGKSFLEHSFSELKYI